MQDSRFSLSVISLLIFFNFIFWLAYVVGNHFTGVGFNEAVIYHIFYGIQGFDISLYAYHLIAFLLLTLIVLILCIIIPFKYLRFFPFPNLAILGLILALVLQPLTNNLLTIYGIPLFNRSFVGDLDPVINQDLKLSRTPNIVYIYAESLEATFLDQELYPDLLPNIHRFMKQGLVFSNIHQTYGASSTIAGMIASQCGVPFDINAIIDQEQPFLPSLNCLGDILAENGYHLSYSGGASLEFAGKGNFYRSHSFHDVKGSKRLSSQLDDPAYINKWGLYDDSLFKLLKQDLDKLAKGPKPFAQFVLTLDTHHPDYFTSESCTSRLKNSQLPDELKAFKCSDLLIGELINHIRDSSFGSETMIILGSDHLSPDTKLFKGKTAQSQRRNLLVILDNAIPSGTVIDKKGSTLDITPTLLNLLGTPVTKHNLGISLLGNQATLYEVDKELNSKLANWTFQLRKFN